jgi:hypothetical protein
MKKPLVIILSIIGVLVVAASVKGALVLLGGINSPSEEPEFVEKDLGTCSVVSHATVAETLDPYSETVGQPVNTGYALDQSGEAQRCTYALQQEASSDNQFTVGETVFENAEEKTAAVARFSELESVGGVGELTYYTSVEMEKTPDLAARTLYALYVFNGSTQYDFELVVPTKSTDLTDATAKAALLEIAGSASL